MGDASELKSWIKILKGASALSAFALFFVASEYLRVSSESLNYWLLAGAALFLLYLCFKLWKVPGPGVACTALCLIYVLFLQYQAEHSFSRLSNSSLRCESLLLPVLDRRPGTLCTLTHLKRRLRFLKPELSTPLIKSAFQKFSEQGNLDEETALVLLAFFENEHPRRGLAWANTISELREELDYLETKALMLRQFDSAVPATESIRFKKEILTAETSFENQKRNKPASFLTGERTLMELRFTRLKSLK